MSDWSTDQPLSINQPHVPYTIPSISTDGPLSISFMMSLDHIGAVEAGIAIMKLGDYNAVMDDQECLPCLTAWPGAGSIFGSLGNSIFLQYRIAGTPVHERALCHVHDWAFEEGKTYQI